jgi:hypothetical protein
MMLVLEQYDFKKTPVDVYHFFGFIVVGIANLITLVSLSAAVAVFSNARMSLK